MDVLFQTSLIAAFVAGIVALFAPCCISFLLPAYLGSVFKEKERVVLMTLIFGLGIFVVMMPAVLGVAVLSKALFEYHDIIYYLGGVVMILSSIITFLGLKFPMPSTFLSPNFIGALSIGAMYVLGMVIPLLFIAVFLSGKVKGLIVLRKPIMRFMFWGKERVVILSNFIASIIFLFTGILIIYLKSIGRLGMEDTEGFTKMIQDASVYVDKFIGGNMLLNLVFVVAIVFVLYKISKKA